MNHIEKLALDYKDIERSAVRFLAAGSTEAFLREITKLRKIKEQIKVLLLEKPLLSVTSSDAEKTIFAISNNEQLPIEKALENSSIGDYLSEEFTDNEIDEIGSDIFYSWYSHYEYVRGLLTIGSLILSHDDIPKNLKKFINEARQCFAFQQYNAVVSLCRTILEVSVKDISIKYGILPEDSVKVKQIDSRKVTLYFLIQKLSDIKQIKFLKHRLHWIRKNTNYVIHGNESVSSSKAANILKETIIVVKKLFELQDEE